MLKSPLFSIRFKPPQSFFLTTKVPATGTSLMVAGFTERFATRLTDSEIATTITWAFILHRGYFPHEPIKIKALRNI